MRISLYVNYTLIKIVVQILTIVELLTNINNLVGMYTDVHCIMLSIFLYRLKKIQNKKLGI